MKIPQMYALMLMLINNKKLTREYAAERLEVSERTVQRYIEALSEAGVPVSTACGRSGGYSIPDDYKLPYTLFTPDDIERITTSIGAMSLSFGDRINEDILQKLASVSGGGRDYVMPTVIIDAGGWNNAAALRSKLDAIAAATDQHITVKIKYTDKDGQESERSLDPYCLALKEGIWYVYGWCHARGEFRIFRLARMRTITLTDNAFRLRRDADVHAALSADMVSDIMIRLEFDESSLTKIEEWLGEDSVKPAGEKYTASAMVAEGEHLILRLLSLGGGVTVLSPEPVRSRLAEAAGRIAAKYLV